MLRTPVEEAGTCSSVFQRSDKYKCPACGQQMGLIAGFNGFGMRQLFHESRCKGVQVPADGQPSVAFIDAVTIEDSPCSGTSMWRATGGELTLPLEQDEAHEDENCTSRSSLVPQNADRNARTGINWTGVIAGLFGFGLPPSGQPCAVVRVCTTIVHDVTAPGLQTLTSESVAVNVDRRERACSQWMRLAASICLVVQQAMLPKNVSKRARTRIDWVGVAASLFGFGLPPSGQPCAVVRACTSIVHDVTAPGIQSLSMEKADTDSTVRKWKRLAGGLMGYKISKLDRSPRAKPNPTLPYWLMTIG